MGSEGTWKTVAAGLRAVWWASLLAVPSNLLSLLVTFQAATGERDQLRGTLLLACALGAFPWMIYLLGQWWCLAGADTRGGTPLGWGYAVALVGTFVFAAAAAAGFAVWGCAILGLAALVSGVLWLVYLFRLARDLQSSVAHDRLTTYRKRLVTCVVAAIVLSWCEWVTVRRPSASAVGLILTAASAYSIYISRYYFAGLRATAAAVERLCGAGPENSSDSR